MDPDLMTDEQLAERAAVIVPSDGGYGMRTDAVMQDQLREMIATAYHGVLWGRWVDRHPFALAGAHYYEVADTILRAIADAGWVLVEADRWERVRNYARSCDYDCICVHGDLDGEAGA